MAETRRVVVIGIGAGHPDHVTLQAIDALRRADVVFVPTKGRAKQDLARVRRDLCDRFLTDRPHRVVEYAVPTRAPAGDDYRGAVDDWHDRLAAIHAGLLRDELRDGECGAYLVWGDPTLYDSLLRILERVRASGLQVACEVVPGISSVQALAAAHGIPLNTIGQSILITTGRKLSAGVPDGIDTIVVMLDDGSALRTVAPDTEIFWGAYVGTPDQILIAGRAGEVIGTIEIVRAEARAAHGWIMDVYLLRRPVPTGS
ncbi:Precorrin-6A synthase [Rhodovulum sp. PH10]|uniref:precorrin-6A synthase (deacetylating) n=1 Tax=Rhodovulum sp. PH10 TaxID=1187851 RepID=UPI00027C2BC1|nr:precorrin-6A synthase (deacetylating) [Rhodovulum sp. PH10]EJW10021.1 Precorrin-6A synthase [Rhodovulum sp. PH10]